MNLQPTSESITVQHEFLYSTEMLSFKTGGITLDASKFTADEYVKAGTVVAIGQTGNATGLAQPYQKKDGTTITDAGEVYVVAHDVKVVTGGGNPVVGAVQEGYLNRNKITAADTTQLEADSNYRFKLRG